MITVAGFDVGGPWRATIDSTDIDLISLEIRLDRLGTHRAQFATSRPFGMEPGGDVFSTWPLSDHGPRWVVVVVSVEVHQMRLQDNGVERWVSPVIIATSRLPKLGIFSITSHPALLDLYGVAGDPIGQLRLDDPRLRRNGQPRDHTAPAPIGQVSRVLGS